MNEDREREKGSLSQQQSGATAIDLSQANAEAQTFSNNWV